MGEKAEASRTTLTRRQDRDWNNIVSGALFHPATQVSSQDVAYKTSLATWFSSTTLFSARIDFPFYHEGDWSKYSTITFQPPTVGVRSGQPVIPMSNDNRTWNMKLCARHSREKSHHWSKRVPRHLQTSEELRIVPVSHCAVIQSGSRLLNAHRIALYM